MKSDSDLMIGSLCAFITNQNFKLKDVLQKQHGWYNQINILIECVIVRLLDSP